MSAHPIKVTNVLWEQAKELVEPPQMCLVVVSDPPGTGTGIAAFRHNCGSVEILVLAVREFLKKLEAGEARRPLTLLPTP